MGRLERVSCPLCRKRDEKFLFTRDGFRVVRCQSCGLVYINPRLKLSVLESLYNENQISPEQYYEANIPQDTVNFARRMKIITKHHPRPGRLLDIGCNIGTLMHVARAQGWKTIGVEFNRSAAAFGRRRFGLKILEEDFTKTKFPKNSFDVVVMNDVIEHVIDPVRTLREVNRIMKKGGLLFMSTPNIGALVARASGSRWLHIKPNEHLLFFTPKTIKTLCEKAGFRMTHWQSIGRVRSLETILEKSKTYSKLPYLASRLLPRAVRNLSIHINPGDEMAVLAVKE